MAVMSGFVGIALVALMNLGLYPSGLLGLGLVLDCIVGGVSRTYIPHRSSYGHDYSYKGNALWFCLCRKIWRLMWDVGGSVRSMCIINECGERY